MTGNVSRRKSTVCGRALSCLYFLKWDLVLRVSGLLYLLFKWNGFCTSCRHVVMSILAHKTLIWETNKCFGNVSVALETIVPAWIPLVWNYLPLLFKYLSLWWSLHWSFSKSIKLPRCEYAKPFGIYNNGTSTGESVIFWTAVFPLMRRATGPWLQFQSNKMLIITQPESTCLLLGGFGVINTKLLA